MKWLICAMLCLPWLAPRAEADPQLLRDGQTILFLGDSITQAGDYVANFDAWLVKTHPEKRIRVINAGLASETVSGLSEEGHARGRFPRPDLHERLERVLEKTKPDLIIACYGMNCGIYQPLDEERFKAFRDGILRLRDAAYRHDAAIVHLTPPIFDNHNKGGFDYDEVLTTYSGWLVNRRNEGWLVADLHSEMRAKVDAAKEQDPKFTLQRDHIHPNAAGHWMMAQSLISYFGDDQAADLQCATKLLDKARLVAVKRRMQIYQRAIHAETHPKRPGVPKGGNLESAAEAAKKLEDRIYGR